MSDSNSYSLLSTLVGICLIAVGCLFLGFGEFAFGLGKGCTDVFQTAQQISKRDGRNIPDRGLGPVVQAGCAFCSGIATGEVQRLNLFHTLGFFFVLIGFSLFFVGMRKKSRFKRRP